ncbi:hypothetical protein J3458_016829 [Metarhizium acridum]|uniref:uncharacterized protein n=1 Tax=Metarhizium acridum TaxID=92637 RepID=UPI001C6BD699|nr:hypothetical protein J3458_016829 [Metarhizium acridum]
MDPRFRHGGETAPWCCASAQAELSLSRIWSKLPPLYHEKEVLTTDIRHARCGSNLSRCGSAALPNVPAACHRRTLKAQVPINMTKQQCQDMHDILDLQDAERSSTSKHFNFSTSRLSL